MTDYCIVLYVKVHAIFVLNGELILLTLSKQKKTSFVNLRGELICFILCEIMFSSNVSFDRMALGLLSVFKHDL